MDGLRREVAKNLRNTIRTLRWYEWGMAAIMAGIALWAMIQAFLRPEAGGNPPWLTVVNFVSAIAGIFCVFFCARASVSNFAFGIVNTLAYIVYLAWWHIWGTMCLELFLYLPMGIIGWVQWAGHRDAHHRERTLARRMNAWQNLLTGGCVLGITLVAHWILARAGGEVPWLDAATVAIGITATGLQALRYREQYVWWLVTDVVSVAMYIQHFDPVYLTKRSIYLIVAVIGLINWIRLSRRNTENR